MKRALLIVGGVLVVAIVVGLFVLYSSLDSIIEGAIESYGSEILGAPVRVGSVSIDPANGKGAIRGLVIGNPEGFETDHAFSLGEVEIELDLGSVTGDPIVIRHIRVTEPEVTYEVGVKGSNIAALQRNVDAYVGPGGDAPAESEEGPGLVIEDLRVTGSEVTIHATGVSGATVPLPDLQLRDIGKQENGASPAEVAKTLLGVVAKRASAAVAQAGVKGAVEQGKGALGGAAEEGKKRLGDLFK